MPMRFIVDSISERMSCASSVGHGEVAALDARAVAHVAHLVLGVGVPGGVERVDLVGDLVHLLEKRTSSNRKNSASGPK
jgi:hypothetical protein